MRIYVLVTSFYPLVAYIYEDGLGRFATQPYSTDDIDDRTIHLTNYSLNKHSSTFVRPNATLTEDAQSKTRANSRSLVLLAMSTLACLLVVCQRIVLICAPLRCRRLHRLKMDALRIPPTAR